MSVKAKLKKSSLVKISKSIPVEDKAGNKHILKATVVTVKNSSAEIVEDEFSTFSFHTKVVRPPLSQSELAVLSEVSSELEQVIDSMAVGIHGFGGRLKKREMTEEQEAEHSIAIAEEKAWLDSFIHFPNPKQTWRKLTKTTRKDLEKTGNAYWELVRSKVKPDRYSCINKMNVSGVFLGHLDKKFSRMKRHYVCEDLKIRSKIFTHKFRKVVNIVGNKKVFFKEFGDVRVMDRRTGDIIAASPKQWEEKAQEDEVFKKKFPQKIWANEVYHFKHETSRRTPYGMPRFTGNIIAIKGSRSADETNIITQQNNHVPSMVISVAGGQLTGGSIDRVQEFIDTQIKSDSNYSKFLILEAEGSHDGLSPSGTLKIDIKPLTSNQVNDQLWQKYDENNASKLRRSFRLPPIMVGRIEDINRSTATESERLAEKYVYNPEREDFDDEINCIFMQQHFRFWIWKTNSPNITNDEDLVAILTGAEKTGGLTPRISRMLLEDILNRDLPPLKETEAGFDVDLPFSYSLAKLIQSMGAANREGTFAPQGQIPSPSGPVGRPNKPENNTGQLNNTMQQIPVELVEQIFNEVNPQKILNDLMNQPEKTLEHLRFVRDRLEDSLDEEVFGKPRGDYFDHEH